MTAATAAAIKRVMARRTGAVKMVKPAVSSRRLLSSSYQPIMFIGTLFTIDDTMFVLGIKKLFVISNI